MPKKQSKTPKKRTTTKKKATGRPPNKNLSSCQTLKQASVATGLAVATIKRIRDDYAPKCFRSGRIYTIELQKWVADNSDKLMVGDEPQSKEEWQIEEIKRRCEKIEIGNKRLKGDLIPVSEILDMVTLLATEIVKIHKQNETNLPVALANMEQDQIRSILRNVTEDVCKRMQPILEKWNPSDE